MKNRDVLRQSATLVTILATFVINLLSVTLPLGGKTTQQISDQFQVYLIPSGPTFAVWGVIYALLLAFGIYQVLPRNREDELLRRLGWVPVNTCLFNIAWIFLWQYEVWLFIPTLLAIVALLESLATIHERTRGVRSRASRWLVAFPFSVYFGWVTLATVLNVAVVLRSMGLERIGSFDDRMVAAAVILVVILIAGTVVLGGRDAGFGLAVIWAFNGIRVKEASTPYVADAALLGMVLIAAAVALTLLSSLREGLERAWARRSAAA